MRLPSLEDTMALFALPFRPLFLLASLLALTAIPLWVLVLGGVVALPAGIDPLAWHAHEMTAGFGGAILGGFLLTAAANWTGRRTLTGPWLVALVLLWLGDRLGGAGLIDWRLAALCGAGYWLTVFAGLAWMIVPAGQIRRQIVPLTLPLLLAGQDAIWHQPHPITLGQWTISRGFLFILLFAVLWIAGRVFPFFTERALNQTGATRSPWLDRTALTLFALWAGVELILPGSWWAAGLAIPVAIAHLLRLRGWYLPGALRVPLTAVLYIGFGMMPVALLTQWLVPLGVLPMTNWFHLLAIGSFALVAVGMMSRVSLGHTGRPLQAAPLTVAAWCLLGASVIPRVLAGGNIRMLMLHITTGLWSAAFLLFLIVYAPILIGRRPDGRPG